MKQISGNKLLMKALKEENVNLLFGYPGGYNIDMLDELYKQDFTEVVLPRHEQGLIHGADGYARATGKVGVCLVTSGPGATNLVTGIATANYDSVPLVCITGQVSRNLIGNDAFQEVDMVGITRNICKYGVTVSKREDLGRRIKEAFYIARTGRPGVVVLDLPKDMMLELGDNTYPDKVDIRGYKPNVAVHIGQLKRAIKMLKKAKNPLFLAGGGINIGGANEIFNKLVETTKVPVVTTVMGKGSIPTNSPYYVGNMGLHGAYASNMAVGECDLLFSIGARFNDRVTGKVVNFAPNAQIVHIDIDTASISRNVQVDVPIVADAQEACEKLLEYATELDTEDWLNKINEWKLENPLKLKNNNVVNAHNIINEINKQFNDFIVVTDVGQHQMWCSQFIELDKNKKVFMSGGLGTMGYGLPASMGVQIGKPEATVISISGDGGFQMNLQELATIVGQELPIIICIFNNYKLGMVRQMQKLNFGKRYMATCLSCRKSCKGSCSSDEYECPPYVPDFMKLADSYGILSIRVGKIEDIATAFNTAIERRSKNLATFIEFIIDCEELVLPVVRGGSSIEDMILDY